MVTIRGLQPVSLVDFPGQVCTTVFFGGCNFRCPWCHNRQLVEEPWTLPAMDPGKVYRLLEERRNWVQAVCLSGGEPTLAPGLEAFIAQVKDLGFKVKLDTNGTQPERLARLLKLGLVDYVAMDIKGPPAKYRVMAGVPVDIEAIEASVGLLKDGTTHHEFRTTVVPGLLQEDDLLVMGRWLEGGTCYVLQQFVAQENVLKEEYRLLPPHEPQFLEELALQMEVFFARVEVR